MKDERQKAGVYDNSEVVSAYDQSRRLPPLTLELWRATFREMVPIGDIEHVLDVGCGTGRLARLLGDAFSADVVGVEPSPKMLAVAQGSAGPHIRFAKGTAEATGCAAGFFDLAFLSMVVHHVGDHPRAWREMKRVLRTDGYLLIRNSTVENITDHPLFGHFPEARSVELGRMPSRRGLIDEVTSEGFTLTGYRTVLQIFAENPDHYVEKVGMRSLSSLNMIDDQAFERGLRSLRASMDILPASEPVREPVDVFAFRSAHAG